MQKTLKTISGILFLIGAIFIALIGFDVKIPSLILPPLKMALVFGIGAAGINFVNWRASEHPRVFTQLYWLGFLLLLIGSFIVMSSIVPGVVLLSIGLVTLLYSFKFSPSTPK